MFLLRQCHNNLFHFFFSVGGVKCFEVKHSKAFSNNNKESLFFRKKFFTFTHSKHGSIPASALNTFIITSHAEFQRQVANFMLNSRIMSADFLTVSLWKNVHFERKIMLNKKKFRHLFPDRKNGEKIKHINMRVEWSKWEFIVVFISALPLEIA